MERRGSAYLSVRGVWIPRAAARRRALLSVVGASIVALAAAAVVEGGRGALPEGKGRIVFATDRGGGNDFQLYTVRSDGTGFSAIKNSGPGFNPKWSRRGKRIAFVRTVGGNAEIFVMNANGTGARNVSKSRASDINPSWSPDEQFIAFASDRGDDRDDDYEIYIVPVDGSSGPRRLTRNDKRDKSPAWSPDGKQIAYEGDGQIHVLNATSGKGDRALTLGGANTSPAWSPDGRRIAYSANQDDNFDIYSIASNGADKTRLTDDRGLKGAKEEDLRFSDTDPVWSPDGEHIAFTSTRSGKLDIYVMSRDGKDLQRLTEDENSNKYEDTTSDWWPQIVPFGELRERIESGVVRLEAETCDGDVVGTGFLVGGRFIATANHVVSDALEISVVRRGRRVGAAVVVGSDRRKDVALLRTETRIDGYGFSFAGRHRAREDSVILGYPQLGRSLKLTEGRIENQGQTFVSEDGVRRSGLLQISEGVPPGNSGGPLVRREGEKGDAGDVLGLVIGRGTDVDETYAVPAAVVAKRVSQWKRAPKPAKTTC